MKLKVYPIEDMHDINSREDGFNFTAKTQGRKEIAKEESLN
jgi:hypothetical protein